jgi:hypothetical protein
MIEETGMSSIKRQTLIWLLATVFLASVSFAAAQQPKKVPRIGYLSPVDPATESARSEPIRLALRERGYLEGQNIATEYLFSCFLDVKRYVPQFFKRLPSQFLIV